MLREDAKWLGLIELEIPSHKVLLSDFDGWHAVLNNHHFCETDAEYNYYEQYENQEDNENLLRKSKEATWLKIFSIENLPEDWAVQGITWEILPEYIIKSSQVVNVGQALIKSQ